MKKNLPPLPPLSERLALLGELHDKNRRAAIERGDDTRAIQRRRVLQKVRERNEFYHRVMKDCPLPRLDESFGIEE